MNKGQIFSIDFLIAMILMIFFLGLLLSLGEIGSYERKEQRIRYELESKTQAALIALTNSPQYNCKLDTGSYLAYSFDSSKFNGITNDDLKKYVGLDDYNLSLFLDGVKVTNHNEDHISKNIYSVDVKVLFCTGDINYTDIQNCMDGSCTNDIENKILSVMVSK